MSSKKVFYIKYCNYLAMVIFTIFTVYSSIARLVGGDTLLELVCDVILLVMLIPVLYKWNNKVEKCLYPTPDVSLEKEEVK